MDCLNVFFYRNSKEKRLKKENWYDTIHTKDEFIFTCIEKGVYYGIKRK